MKENHIKNMEKNLKGFINSGAILINLELLRKDNIFPKIYKFLQVNNGSLLFLDQDAINIVCNKKNGFYLLIILEHFYVIWNI